MKLNKITLLTFLLLIITASFYRVWQGRPEGFVPHIAMAILAGAVIKNRRLAIALPLLSMLLSDLIYEILWVNGLTAIPGFYQGQWQVYILIAGLVAFGFLMKKVNTRNVIGFSVSGSVLFFIVSNFLVWAGHGGLQRPMTFNGLMLCYGDALAFYRDYGLINGFIANPLLGDLFFSFVLFGAYYMLNKFILKPGTQLT